LVENKEQPLLDVDSVVAVDWLGRFLLEFGQYWLIDEIRATVCRSCPPNDGYRRLITPFFNGETV